MKKTLKTFALITVTWTLAEFVTMWRMQDTRTPLKRYIKTYVSGQKQAFAASYAAGERVAQGTGPGLKAEAADFATKKYYVQ